MGVGLLSRRHTMSVVRLDKHGAWARRRLTLGGTERPKSVNSFLISRGDVGSAEWSEQKKKKKKKADMHRMALKISVKNLQAFSFKKTPFSSHCDKIHFLVIFRPGKVRRGWLRAEVKVE